MCVASSDCWSSVLLDQAVEYRLEVGVEDVLSEENPLIGGVFTPFFDKTISNNETSFTTIPEPRTAALLGLALAGLAVMRGRHRKA